MLRAIETKWFGPSAKLGSRIKAIGRKREHDMPELSLTDNWDHGSNPEQNHARVAKLLAASLNWSGLFVGGSTDAGYCFVNMGQTLTPSMIAGHTLSRHPLGIENQDWFYVQERGE